MPDIRQWVRRVLSSRPEDAPTNKRGIALETVAPAYGWRFRALVAEVRPEEAWAGLVIATLRENVVTGRIAGLPFVAFECNYRFQGKSYAVPKPSIRESFASTTPEVVYAMVVLPLPNVVPLLDVFPADWTDHPAEALGLEPALDLESIAFNERFQVFSADPRYAVDLLTPRVMQHMLASRALAWRFEGRTISARYGDEVVTGSLLRQRLEEVAETCADIPDRVFTDWALSDS